MRGDARLLAGKELLQERGKGRRPPPAAAERGSNVRARLAGRRLAGIARPGLVLARRRGACRPPRGPPAAGPRAPLTRGSTRAVGLIDSPRAARPPRATPLGR